MSENSALEAIRRLSFRPERSRPVWRNRHTGAEAIVLDLSVDDRGGFQGGCRQFVVHTDQRKHPLDSWLRNWEPTDRDSHDGEFNLAETVGGRGMSELNRDEWTTLCESVKGDQTKLDFFAEARTRHDSGSLSFTDYDLGVTSDVHISVCKEATDLRLGDLQLLAARGRVVLILQHPPFPISRWTVLYDGNPWEDGDV